MVWPLVVVWCILYANVASQEAWEKPGCHKIGHTRKISVPNCLEFEVETNACRGFCESFSVPSSKDTLSYNSLQPITSLAECCNIMESEDVVYRVLCIGGVQDFVFKSATKCECYHCKKDPESQSI